MAVLTAGAIALLLGIAASAAATGVGGQWGASKATDDRNKALKEELRNRYPELSESQIDALIAQYGDVGTGLMDPGHWGDQTDREGLEKLLSDVDNAYAELGYQPEAPDEAELEKIMQDAYSEIDAENNLLLDLYKDTYGESRNVLQEELMNNATAFNDYRNQVLTNEAMRQQSLAGSTRYELDRQQRNAISRGASAAQRLVANINTQLGLQASSAQQALETSNTLAQSLINQRQANQNIRNAYLDSRNAYNSQVANNLAGQAERRYNYGQARRQGAIDKYNYLYDLWNEKVSNRFQGNSVGEGIYRSRYGTGGSRNTSSNAI